jgi:hypothetical protein
LALPVNSLRRIDSVAVVSRAHMLVAEAITQGWQRTAVQRAPKSYVLLSYLGYLTGGVGTAIWGMGTCWSD